MLEYAIRILSIIVKKNYTELVQGDFDLNYLDEGKNSILHIIFQNFSTNMELNVELCQELLKFGERGGPSQFNINHVNKLGLSPLDMAIEFK